MQVRQSSVRGDRPQCPLDRLHRVHSHGSYHRYRKAGGNEKRRVPRWLCIACGFTISVLPDEMLPYRPVGVGLLESWLDSLYRGRDPPPITEVEKGCLERARIRFLQRIPSLSTLLGQMVETIGPTASQVWMQLRNLGGLVDILGLLAEKFKTSLLGDYRCLQPWSATDSAGETGSRSRRHRRFR